MFASPVDTNYEKALKYYSEGDYYQALIHIIQSSEDRRKKILRKTRKHHENLIMYFHSQVLEGRINLKLGQIDDAESIYVSLNSMISSANQSAYLKGELAMLLRDIAITKDLKAEALDYLQQAKEYFLLAEKYERAIEVMFCMEEYNEFKSDQDRLFQLYTEIIEINKLVPDRKTRQKIAAKTRLKTGMLLKDSDVKQASSNLINAKKKFSQLKLPRFEIVALMELAELRSESDPQRAIEILEQVLVKSDVEEFILLSVLKIMYYKIKLGAYDAALELSLKIGELLPLVEPSKNIASMLLENAITLLLSSNQPPEIEVAKGYARHALEIYGITNDKEGKLLSYFIEGLCHQQLQQDKENSRLKLIPVLAKQINTTMNPTKNSLANKLILALTSDREPQEIIRDIDENNDVMVSRNNAVFFHLLSLYELYKVESSARVKYLFEQARLNYTQIEHRNEDIVNSIDLIERHLAMI